MIIVLFSQYSITSMAATVKGTVVFFNSCSRPHTSGKKFFEQLSSLPAAARNQMEVKNFGPEKYRREEWYQREELQQLEMRSAI